ncbi:hypothetical protein HYW84_00610 [Candidatus Peregrinibacteria bacterium]|nr:hypothetical protein [Candidatus Peregrinibacteria bacterium]
MKAIPAGIEASLLASGFSSTEIAVIRRLLEYDAMTLRELAGRTAKSTGVLDQATRKLIQKGIVQREVINDAVKYAMISLDAVLRWMEEDDRRKLELMTRRQRNFESFLRTVELDKKRPEIEHIEGVANFPQAYRKLLGCGNTLLCYEPACLPAEDHPLSCFMAEWPRMRRKRGVFSNVIAHDTQRGLRYQSRDAFEYRKTVLIGEEECRYEFEKIVCGDTLACFNYAENRACLLKFPELASMERATFGALWNSSAARQKNATGPGAPESKIQSFAAPALPARASAVFVHHGGAIRAAIGSGLRGLRYGRKLTAALLGIASLFILMAAVLMR